VQAGDVRARDAFYLDGAWVPAGARRTSTWRSPRPAPWEYGLEEFPEAKSLQL